MSFQSHFFPIILIAFIPRLSFLTMPGYTPNTHTIYSARMHEKIELHFSVRTDFSVRTSVHVHCTAVPIPYMYRYLYDFPTSFFPRILISRVISVFPRLFLAYNINCSRGGNALRNFLFVRALEYYIQYSTIQP